MALNNIDPQTFIVPDKQVLLYIQDSVVYYKRYTNTISTLEDKTLKALGIAKQQLPCLIYDADLLQALITDVTDTSQVTIANSAKASLESVKIAASRKLDKHIYLTDQAQLKQTLKDITDKVETFSSDSLEVSQLTDNKILVPKKAIPVAVKTNKGTLYNINFQYIAQTQTAYAIDPAPYLAYDNQAVFEGVWTIFFAGVYQKTVNVDSSTGAPIQQATSTTIELEHNKVVKHTVQADQVLTIDVSKMDPTVCASMELWLRLDQVVSFQIDTVTWISDPSFSVANTVYAIVLRWDGSKVLANVAYKVTDKPNYPEGYKLRLTGATSPESWNGLYVMQDMTAEGTARVWKHTAQPYYIKWDESDASFKGWWFYNNTNVAWSFITDSDDPWINGSFADMGSMQQLNVIISVQE